jgi:two-component system, sensor histidine kinase YesM
MRLTLKRRIVLLFAVGIIVPYLGIATVSYIAISSILVQKTQAGIQDSLRQVLFFLENTVRNLGRISQQLSLDGAIGGMMDEYLASTNPYERSMLKLGIRNELNLLAFTNPNAGLIMYYFDDGTGSRDLETVPVKDNFSPAALPLLAKYYGITYFGPHPSEDRFSGQYVLSALRKVSRPDQPAVYVYVESGFKLTQSILNSDRFGERSLHLMLDNDGRIAYSEVPAAFPVNGHFLPGESGALGLAIGYYWFRATGNQGWSLVSLVPKAEYDKERNRWIDQMALLSLVFLAFGVFLALLLYRMVYEPLSVFSREMSWLDRDDPAFASVPTGIPEFDALLDQFQGMKARILALLAEVEQKEKRRADLEIETLLFQINPHFLMNSLYSIHWLAVEKGQDELDRLILALNRLLYYNLGKAGRETTLREELESLEEYIVLQRSRGDFEYSVEVLEAERYLGTEMPRFVLQPLVENALFHGLAGSGHIGLRAEPLRSGTSPPGEPDSLLITVSDDGPGIPEERLRWLLSDSPGASPPDKAGMGIGLRYVKRVLESFYRGRASLEIESGPGKGTRARMRLPLRRAAELRGGEAAADD